MKPQPNHRQQEILSVLQKSGGSARTQTIAQTLDVSEETVRRNIKHLATVGSVEKLHGGARIIGNAEETSFQHRLGENPDAKIRISLKVAEMIPNGSSLFLDIGSTTAFIADALRDHQNLLVVTNSIAVAYKLATRNNNRVFMAGGELRSHDGGAFGLDAMNFADNFQTDFAVLSAAGINATNGFMLFDLEEAKFSRLIMSKSATRIIAADARKFNRVAPVTIGNPELVDYLICDAPPPKDIAQACESWATEITLAN